MTTIPDPYAQLRDSVLQSVLDGRGESDQAIRHAAAEGRGAPGELQDLVDKIHTHPYTVTDEDIARLQSSYSEDQLFEVVVSAALGAAHRRLAAGLEALRDA